MEYDVAIFRPYPFKKGQKIRIEGSKRAGDWEVEDISDTKVMLRCPVTGTRVSWARFCYFVRNSHQQWPSD